MTDGTEVMVRRSGEGDSSCSFDHEGYGRILALRAAMRATGWEADDPDPLDWVVGPGVTVSSEPVVGGEMAVLAYSSKLLVAAGEMPSLDGFMGRLVDAMAAAVAQRIQPLVDEVHRAVQVLRDERAKMPEYLTSEQAAGYAGMKTPATIRDWVRRGKLKGYGTRARLLVRREDLDGMLAGACRGQGDIDYSAKADELLARRGGR